MKEKRKNKITLIIDIVALLIVAFTVAKMVIKAVDPLIEYTEDIDKYTSKGTVLLPDSIPKEATVVAYSHYRFPQDEDVWLELRFSTEDALDRFLEEAVGRVESKMDGKTAPPEGWFREEEGVLGEEWTELIFLGYEVTSEGKNFVSNQIKYVNY